MTNDNFSLLLLTIPYHHDITTSIVHNSTPDQLRVIPEFLHSKSHIGINL